MFHRAARMHGQQGCFFLIVREVKGIVNEMDNSQIVDSSIPIAHENARVL